MPKWPSKLLTVVTVTFGAALLYLDGAVAVSLTLTSAGFWRATVIAYLIAAVAIPAGVVRQSLRSKDSRWEVTRRTAIVSIAMNLAVLPVALIVLSL